MIEALGLQNTFHVPASITQPAAEQRLIRGLVHGHLATLPHPLGSAPQSCMRNQRLGQPDGMGTERIRGELKRLGIHVAKTTIRKYARLARPPPAHGQDWPAFPKNHAQSVWACDFLPVIYSAQVHVRQLP